MEGPPRLSALTLTAGRLTRVLVPSDWSAREQVRAKGTVEAVLMTNPSCYPSSGLSLCSYGYPRPFGPLALSVRL